MNWTKKNLILYKYFKTIIELWSALFFALASFDTFFVVSSFVVFHRAFHSIFCVLDYNAIPLHEDLNKFIRKKWYFGVVHQLRSALRRGGFRFVTLYCSQSWSFVLKRYELERGGLKSRFFALRNKWTTPFLSCLLVT